MRKSIEVDWVSYKRCTWCNQFRLLSEFHKNKKWYLWTNSRCKTCQSLWYRKDYTMNKDKRLTKWQEYKKNNKESVLKYHKEYLRNNREELSQKRKENDRLKSYRKQREIDNKDRRTAWKKEHNRWLLNSIHIKTSRYIKDNNIERPTICPICWIEWKIEAHHPDNNKRNEIVFCCNQCHQRIHHWWFECPKPIDLLQS